MMSIFKYYIIIIPYFTVDEVVTLTLGSLLEDVVIALILCVAELKMCVTH